MFLTIYLGLNKNSSDLYWHLIDKLANFIAGVIKLLCGDVLNPRILQSAFTYTEYSQREVLNYIQRS